MLKARCYALIITLFRLSVKEGCFLMERKLRETARVSEDFMLLRTAAVCLGAFEKR